MLKNINFKCYFLLKSEKTTVLEDESTSEFGNVTNQANGEESTSVMVAETTINVSSLQPTTSDYGSEAYEVHDIITTTESDIEAATIITVQVASSTVDQTTSHGFPTSTNDLQDIV